MKRKHYRNFLMWAFLLLVLILSANSTVFGTQSSQDVNLAISAHQNPCEGFGVTVTTQTGSFDFCSLNQWVSFSAQAQYDIEGEQPVNPVQIEFNWSFAGEIKTGPNVSHEYNASGVYPFSVTATDINNGCQAVFHQNVRLATIPNFTNTNVSSDTVCANETFSLNGRFNPVTWTGFPSQVETTERITQGMVYASQLNFDVFEPGQVLSSIDDFDRICIQIEHIDFGHLQFELECPDGSYIILKEAGPGGANLGEPVIFDNTVPGLGYEYCFSTSPQFGFMSEASFAQGGYFDQSGSFIANRLYVPPGQYTSGESFGLLTGCPLNGPWTLRVVDNITGTSGHVFGWSMYFDQSLYPDSLFFTPEMVGEQWFDGGSPVADPLNIRKADQGEYEFLYRVMDNLGCTWDTTVVVTVLPLPRAEITSVIEIPVCEEDSTLFFVSPLNGNPDSWLYQWMMEGVDLPGRTYDTLMAKIPGNYSVLITDTITGCMSIFDLLLFTKNCDLVIPNVFTPNGDGINDYFEITNLENYPNSQMVIFNRNGKKIFEHNDYSGNWWDGANHPAGTYFYVLTYTRQGSRRQTQGIITILR